MKKIITISERETFNFGLTLGKKCRGGEVFALCGNLGAGKTKLLQGLAKGLGVRSLITSPTFNILKLYTAAGKIKNFCHIDAYRLKSEKDLIFLGVKEFFDSPETVTAIEWAEKVKKIWPRNVKIIKIKAISENQREITFSASR
jgi:tRNA threonylcarbamoyladenosine biosynthesis protein TsaE